RRGRIGGCARVGYEIDGGDAPAGNREAEDRAQAYSRSPGETDVRRFAGAAWRGKPPLSQAESPGPPLAPAAAPARDPADPARPAAREAALRPAPRACGSK